MAKTRAKLIAHTSEIPDAALDLYFAETVDDARKGGIVSFALIIEHSDRSVSTSWRSSYRGDCLRLGGAIEKLKCKVLGLI